MRRGVVVWLVSVALLSGVTVASGRGERDLTEDELRAEMALNRTLAAYVERNGFPDVAESRFLADRPPWDKYEVTLYYFDAHKEIAFARASILGDPDIQITRYERPLTDAQIAALSSRAHMARSTAGLGPADRAEASARRAEDAAARVEAAAATAENAADRAEAVTARMERAFHRALRK
jgi:hypothetical protein